MSEGRTFAAKKVIVLGAVVLGLLAACATSVEAGQPRFKVRPVEDGGLSAARDPYSWGPGNPTLWTRYFDTPYDWENEVNPHYINMGGLVPRNSFAVEIAGILDTSCGSNGYPECPHVWRFFYLDPQGGPLYWLQAYAYSRGGYRWTEWTDSDGYFQRDQGITLFYIYSVEWVNCQLPNGNYTANAAFWSGPNLVYHIPFPFTIGGNQCGPPPVPVPIGPAGCVPTVRPTLSWNASTGAQSYQVVVSDVQTGAEVINQPNWPGTSYTIPINSPLQPNRRYSWVVRAFNQGGGYSAYSNPLLFTPHCQAPVSPHASFPVGCIDTTTPTLQWTASAGATSYRVRLVDGQTGGVTTQTVTTNSWTIPAGVLVENRQYTWTVEAFNEHGGSAPSNALSFTPRCGAPAAPVAQAPSGCITTLMPTLTWSIANGATHYDVYVTDSEDDVQVLREPFHTSTTYVVPPGILQADRPYHWRVRAYSANVNEHSAWSNLLSFTPQCGPPREAPIVYQPRECVDTLQPTFSWSAVARATKYHLYVSNTETSEVVINEQPNGTTYTPPPGRLQPDTQYHWHVKGINGQYSGPTSETLFFTPMCEEVTDEEEDRPDDTCSEGGPPQSVDKPVSVLTGNMYFDHVDLAVSGVGSITFGRSYNSSNVKPDWPGIFGPGWSHPYETSIWIRYRLLVLRQPNGAVLYFQDDDDNKVFEPRVRRADTSTIRKEADGTYVHRFRYGGSQVFDAHGRLIRLVDLVGNQTNLVRDPTGKLLSIQDAGGRTVTLTYTGERLTKVDGPGALVTVTYTYDTSNRLQTVTYGDGSGYRFEYDGNGPVKTVFDRTNRVLEAHTYDEEGRALTSTLADGRESHTFAYDALYTTVTDGLGAVTQYDYAEIGGNKHVVRITGACGSCGGGAELQEWTYDAAGRVATYSRGSQVVAAYEYDPVTGDRLAERDGLGQATVYTYYPDGRVRTITGPDGSRKALAYVAAGPSRVADAIDATRTRVSTITYTTTGKIEQVTDPRGKITRFVYDPVGDLREIHAPENQVWRFTYDAMGRRLTATSPLHAIVTTAYDERGRTKHVTSPDGTFVEYAYDDGGRLTQMSDSLGRNTRHGYDAYGRLEFSVDSMGGVTRRSYDLMSRLAGLTDALGQTTLFEYDALGRLARTVHPDGAVEALTYDALGREDTRTDRRGVVTSYRYDAAGRVLGRAYSDGTPSVSYVYDAAGKMIGATTTAGEAAETLEWTYDLLGRSQSETSARSGSTLAYTYDDASNRTAVSIDGMPYLTYEYDDASRLRRLLWGSEVFRFEYDATRRKEMEFPNGVITRYRYDWQGMSRLVEMNAFTAGSPVLYAGYTYDTTGNRTTRLVDAFLEEYSYDRLDRLVEILTPPAGAARFGYDAVGNRIREESGGTVLTASFEAGNRLASRLPGGTVAVAGSVDETAHVTVNDRSARALEGRRFESEIATAPGPNAFQVRAMDLAGNQTTRSYQIQVGSTAENRYNYDANGNLIRRQDAGHDVRYRWDAENRLTHVLRDNIEIARFGYDPLGRRILKVADGTTTSYMYDGEDIIQEGGGVGATGIRYVHGPGIDEPLARESAQGREYFHADGLGSIVRLTNQAGTVILRRQYDAWGNPVEGGDMPSYAFTGREWDPETGLYYYRARYYDPKLGRFISEDPIGFSAGVNFYLYVGGNPVLRRDPSGLDWRESLRDWMLDHSIVHEVIVNVGRLELLSQYIKPHEHAPDEPAAMAAAIARSKPMELPLITCGVSGGRIKLPRLPLGGKAPRQVTPGMKTLTGQYVDDLGRVQPWTAHYDQFGRLIARTDYNAGNKAHGIPDVHHTIIEYSAQHPHGHPVVNHAPGPYQP